MATVPWGGEEWMRREMAKAGPGGGPGSGGSRNATPEERAAGFRPFEQSPPARGLLAPQEAIGTRQQPVAQSPSNPYAAIARLPPSLWTKSSQAVLNPAFGQGDDTSVTDQFLRDENGEIQTEMVDDGITGDSLKAAGLGAFQSKFGAMHIQDDGSYVLRMQQPGGHKYDLMDVTYKKDPATGELVMVGAPNTFKQQSSKTEFGQGAGKVAALVGGAALLAPVAAGGFGLGGSLGGGLLGNAAAAGAVGAGGSALGGGNTQQNLRAGATAALMAGAMTGAQQAGWLPGSAPGDGAGWIGEGVPSGVPQWDNAFTGAGGQWAPGFTPGEQPSFRPSQNYGEGMTGTETAAYDAGALPQEAGPKPWDLPLDDPNWQPDPADYRPTSADPNTPPGDSVEIRSGNPFDPMPQFNAPPGEFGDPFELTNPYGTPDWSMDRFMPPVAAPGGSPGGGTPPVTTPSMLPDIARYVLPVLGAVAGSQPSGGGTSTRDQRIDPRMDEFVYGPDGIPAMARARFNANPSGMNDNMRRGLAMRTGLLTDPRIGEQLAQYRTQGLLQSQGNVAGNPFTDGRMTLGGAPRGLLEGMQIPRDPNRRFTG